jgi:uncharacterized repeat protein (TIGR01451 family)
VQAASRRPERVGGIATLTFTVDNPNAAAMTGLAFSDTFPPGLQVAGTPNVNDTCGFAATLPAAGDSSLSLSGGSVGPSAGCAFRVDVVATAVGNLQNIASALSSNEAAASAAPPPATLVAGAVVPLVAVPTLSGFGLAIIALLLAAGAVWRLRGA